MFTGIIQALGTVDLHQASSGDLRLGIDCGDLDLAHRQIGDSIAVNGVCLTAVELGKHSFVADVSLETLQLTSLGQLALGSPVNLEPALTLNDALGGHLVSGHVDGLATLVEMEAAARSVRYRFAVEPALQHYIAIKGSVTLDGCSLTVNAVDENRFDVNIVPHTQQRTVFHTYQVGARVNIEVDIIARYLERLLQGRADGAALKDQQFAQTLIKSGFINHE
ncbi:riboflavin synthase [Gammaproteobacteria bacterium]|nr:riboflavin synthase [Gammaproteobacteria bacterium]